MRQTEGASRARPLAGTGDAGAFYIECDFCSLAEAAEVSQRSRIPSPPSPRALCV